MKTKYLDILKTIFSIILIIWSFKVHSQQFYPDQTFGKGGLDTLNVRNSLSNLSGVSTFSDGKILTGGYSSYGSNRVVLIKYKTNGTLDSSFAKNGILDTIFGSFGAAAYTFKILNNNKIMIGGYFLTTTTPSNVSRMLLARLNPNGSIDNTFGVNGKSNIILPVAGGSYIYTFEFNPDSSIIVGGGVSNSGSRDFVIAKVKSNGIVDSTFGTNGIVIRDETLGDDIYGLAISSTGGIYLAGDLKNANSRYYFAVMKYNSNGSIATFGTNGLMSFPMSNGDAYISRVRITPNGKLLLGGYAFDGTQNNLALAQLNPDGSFDTFFGNSGKLIVSNAYSSSCFDLKIIPSGNFLVTGWAQTTSGVYLSAVSKFDQLGNSISSFGSNGKFLLNTNITLTYIQNQGQVPFATTSITFAEADTNKFYLATSIKVGSKNNYGIFKFTTNSSTGINTSTSSSVNLSNGLIAMYPFNGNANDESGNGYNGTVVGANLTTDRFGNSNRAYYFSGIDENYILAPAPYNFKKFSISLWFKAENSILSVGGPAFCSFKTNLTEELNASLTAVLLGSDYDPITEQRKIKTCSYTPSNLQTCLTSLSKATLNNWHHLAIVYDASQKVDIYLDGSFESSTPINGNAQKDYNYLFIGRETLLPSSVSTKFIGTLDDYSIYNRSLTLEEIKVLSSDTLVNLATGLIAMYPFNGNANDESGNGNNGTVVGANLTTDRFGNPNRAYYFNGLASSQNYILAPAPYNSKVFSVSFWMKPDVDILNNENPVTFSFKDDLGSLYNSPFVSFFLGTTNPTNDFGKFSSCSYTPLNVQTCLLPNIKPTLGIWHHVVHTFDENAQMSTYIDGNFISSIQVNGSDQKNYQYLFIGRESSVSGSEVTKFKGVLDDYRIYTRVININEIKALYGDTLVNLSTGLIAMYPFNGNANDESGNGNNGTVVGANLTTDRFGNSNKAYYFNGLASSQNYILAPAPYNSKVFSVSFWMKPDLDILSNENPVTFSFKDGLGSLFNSPFVSFFVGTTNPTNDFGKYTSCSYTPLDVQTCLLTNIKPTLGIWHHVVHTFDENAQMSTYIDGNFISSIQVNGSDLKNYQYLFMGRESLVSGSEVTKFKGVLDDYRIYTRVINSNEIKALYGDTLVNLSDGLIAMYPFNGNANDESGNNLNGTITGSVPFVNDRMGNPNKAIQLNGNPSNYVSVAHNDLFNFTSTTNFSISLWMYSDPNPNHFVLFSKGRDVHSGYNSYGISSDGFYIVESLGQGLNTPNTAYYGSIKNSQWNHIVCIANSSNQKMYYYLNGNLVKDTSYAPISINNLYPLVFGRHFVYPDGSGGAEYPFTGYLDDISIYNRALNPNEIKALYGDNSVNLNNGLIAMYPFNGNANDESGNGNHGTVTGANLTTDRFGNSNKAYTFNGINNYIEIKDTALLRPSTMSISLWAKVPQKAIYQLIYKGKWEDASSESYSINYLEGNTLNYPTFAIKSGSNCIAANGWQIASNYADLIDFNKWHHIVATYDGTIQKIYLDNVLVATNNYTGTIDKCKGSNLNFGRSWSNLPYFFKGALDDISIYNRALNPNEIKNLSNSIFIQNPNANCSTTTITRFIPPTPTHTITSLNTVTVTKTVFHTVTVPTYITIRPVNQGGRESENDVLASYNYNTNFLSVTSTTNSVYNVEILDNDGISLSIHYNLSSIDIAKLKKGDYLLKAKGFDGAVIKLFRLFIE